jgi:Signal transduction histidine kinase regulating citrate/malate metabolism
MEQLFPDFVRGVVSIIMNVLLVFSLLRPKYSKKFTNFIMLCVFTLDLAGTATCYLIGNLTLLAKLNIIAFPIICLIIRPFFLDTMMQWLFSFLTVLNINAIVLVLSFIGSRYLPYPLYAHTVLRVILFGIFIFLLRRGLKSLYRQMVEHWTVFFYVAVSIFIAFAYFILRSDDIVGTLTKQIGPLLLIILIAFAAYASVFHCFKILAEEYNLREQNFRIQKDKELLQISTEAMEQRIKQMDEAVGQMRIIRHDQRHINATLLELLRQKDLSSAIILIEQQTKAMPEKSANYCENIAVNAAVSYYDSLAAQQGISREIRLDIPGKLSIPDLSLAMVVSNLMENAIHACKKLSPGKRCYIRFTALYTGQLIIEMENPYEGEIVVDEDGYPVSNEEGHGRGTQSIRSFTESSGGELVYHMMDGIFKVRLMI